MQVLKTAPRKTVIESLRTCEALSPQPAAAATATMSAPPRGADPLGYHVSTRTPMKFGGETVHQLVQQKRIQAPSIFKAPTPVAGDLPPRVNLPPENPKYPETKHTLKCAALCSPFTSLLCMFVFSPHFTFFSLSRRTVIHNINQYQVTDRPGTESYDPVLLGGKSLVDHYPYAAITPKECLVNPLTMEGM